MIKGRKRNKRGWEERRIKERERRGMLRDGVLKGRERDGDRRKD